MHRKFRIRDFRSSDYLLIQELWQVTGVGGAHRGDTLEVIERTLSLRARLLVLI